ncbi:hypothetical protein [Thauera sp. 63]|uniref:hypothetical protein n=1 Tax=Thauera sp. 63 TaxID=497321 RepID=UPI0002CF5438|nr:hypothetical protein [Thauera sp. 63]ENO78182.1 phage tail tape measure protein [Thauera sp. 63]
MTDRNLELALRITGDTKDGQQALKALNKAIDESGKASEKALDPFTRSVTTATGGVDALQTALRPLNAAFVALGGVLSVSLVSNMIRGFADLSREITASAQVAGTSVETFQSLAYAAQTVGISQDKLGDIFKDTQDKIGDFLSTGGGELLDFFEKLAPRVGVTAEQFRSLSGPEALQLYVSTLEKANVSQAEMTFFLEAIADDSARLLPLLRNNGTALARLAEEARTLGAIIGEDLVRDGVELDLSLQKLEGRAKGLSIAVGRVLVPALNELAAGLIELATTDMSVFDRLFGSIFRGFDDPTKNPAEEIARIKREIEAFQRGDWKSKSLLENLAPEKALADLQQQLAFWVRKREQAAQPTPEEQDGQRRRLALEGQLVDEIARLEKLRAIEAGKANAEILLDDKAVAAKRMREWRSSISEQINGAKELQTALRSAWQASIEAARQARDEAAAFFAQAKAAFSSRQQQAQARRDRDLSPEEREENNYRAAKGLIDRAQTQSVFAQNAAIDGRAKAAKEYAQEALDLAGEAAQYVNGIGDNSSAAKFLERIGEIEKAALNAQGKIREREGDAQEQQAQSIQQEIAANEARLQALRAELEKPATLKADITQAEAQITALKQQLDGLKDKTVTITVNTVSTAPADTSGMTREELIESIPGRAYGGPLPGRAFSDRSDNVIYRGTPGEWVIQRPAVRYWGANFLQAINEMRMPRFAYGGELGADQRQALADYEGAGSKTPIVLQWPDGSRSPMAASADVADQVVRLFRTAALQRGRRR